MTQDERIAHVIERNRAIWGVLMAMSVVYSVFQEPWWVLGVIAVIGLVTYQLMILLTVGYLSLTLGGKEPTDADKAAAVHELNRRLRTGDASEKELADLRTAAGMDTGSITAFSSEIVGSFMDHPIYEWVEIKTKNVVRRFVFFDVAERDKGGNFMPRLDGEIYAQLNGINYKLVA